ncbi:MAG TPA: Gfo/Idh/MocA family oxidoreductase [Bryobacteraceae bacterium]|jgi:predicted dehydrogenase|nr:Gfo/Idh/MocA family oxidoreductase [Bryobacteraceae bacterium]
MRSNRRIFLLNAAGAMAAHAAAPADQVVLGVIGSGSRGTFVMTVFQKDPAVRIGAICDVYEPNLEKAISTASRIPGSKPKAYRNYNDLLADPDIDAVLIATPEHWHARMVLDALAAGKDIYVEKPLCHTPEEGVRLVEAERQTRSIVQVGMQRRSYDLYQRGRELVAARQLGAVRMVRAWWLNNYLGGGVAQKLDGPLDWEQWQGPAPRRPFDANRFRQWRFYSDYAGGIVADQGAHVFDGIHMLMGAGLPAAVNASAGKPHKPGVDQPESVVAIAEYPEDFIAVFSINYAAMQYQLRNDQLNQLDGSQARMDIGREELKVYAKGSEDAPSMQFQSERGFGYATDLHVQNFLDCVRTRKTPTAPMRVAFQAALVVQMANLSLKQGRRLRWNAAAAKVEG